MSGPRPSIECPCDGAHLAPSFAYDEPPVGETAFDFGQAYHREYRHCGLCGHFFSCHDMDLSALYGGTYVEATYGARIRATYDRIMALPPEASDNIGRVARVLAFAERHPPPMRGRQPRLLDIGSGLAVFPARMREAGWDCTALDPDPRAAEHARSLGLTAVADDFLVTDLTELGSFDIVSLNKVIEHVDNPVAMLRRASRMLDFEAFVYVEVPDGAASTDGPGREEFFIEHHHVFSPASLALTAKRADFSTLAMERLREPSGKFTICAFLRAE
jgi:Methyltransferase domain